MPAWRAAIAGWHSRLKLHGPQQIRHQIGHGRLGVDHRNVHVRERLTHAVVADQIDLDLGTRATEVTQDRHGEMHRETRRHLHTQRPQRRRALVADIIERVLEPIERFVIAGSRY